MTIDYLTTIFGWCSLINLGVLLYWFLFFVFAHDFLYRLHTRWFTIGRETFDAIHYGAMAFYKLATFFFALIPYLVLRLAF